MLESESRSCDESYEQFPEGRVFGDARGVGSPCDARRRIERLRELRHLRELLDDPEFDDLD